ncbi:MAG: hypothetical protein CMI03_07275 [Oceanospirillaceae bacterium]|nr:hypothetical protein [Oceanospirillaceae bacterium]
MPSGPEKSSFISALQRRILGLRDATLQSNSIAEIYMVTLNSDSLLILKTGNEVAINSASGLAAESEDISDLPEGTRASGPGQGWPMGRSVRKYQAFKEIRARKREAGLFLLLQNMHFRHPWRSGV